MKASVLLFLWLSSLFHTSACSSTAGVNNAATTNVNGPRTDENQSLINVAGQSSPTVASSPSANPKDVVLFDGKNYIKKTGWTVPSRDNTYINEDYRSDTVKGVTEKGKEAKITTVSYGYRIPRTYSENFHFEGRDLDYMKGNLECGGFFEMRVNGKAFMYSIFVKKILPPPVSNSDPHEDPTSYQIQDKDGDGVFETLLGDYDEIVVPNWVLK